MHASGTIVSFSKISAVFCVAKGVKSICVEFDLHKVVITLSYFTEIKRFIYHWIPCKKRFYLYAVELIS